MWHFIHTLYATVIQAAALALSLQSYYGHINVMMRLLRTHVKLVQWHCWDLQVVLLLFFHKENLIISRKYVQASASQSCHVACHATMHC